MILLKSKDGSVAVMNLVDGADKLESIRKFQELHPEYVDYYEGDLELPKSRDFRDAWVLKDNKILIDDKKALKIHLERVRLVRNRKLEELDKEQMIKGLTKDIKARKQSLRDLPATVDTLEWPEGL